MKSLIFNANSVRAIIAGDKTQTRRPMKIQPPSSRYQLLRLVETTNKERRKYENSFYWGLDGLQIIESDDRFFRPKFEIGETVYVKETWTEGYKIKRDEQGNRQKIPTYTYKADMDVRSLDDFFVTFKEGHDGSNLKTPADLFIWKSSMFMPERAARIFLTITDIRAERLQDISEDDAMAEGFHGPMTGTDWGGINQIGRRPSECYMLLWDQVNGKKYPKDANPWLWAYTFTAEVKK